jgi:hypothetical protein
MTSISDPAEPFVLPRAIDHDALAALQTAEGNAGMKDAIKSYLATFDALNVRLEAALGSKSWQEAEHLARMIAGMSCEMGFLALSAAANGLMDAAQGEANPHQLRNEAQMVIIEHERLCLELAGVCPELVA